MVAGVRINQKNLDSIFKNMIYYGTIEDRREYDAELLMKMYDIDMCNAVALQEMIRIYFQLGRPKRF